MVWLVGLAAALALISLGGGLYEVGVVDPVWPKRPDIVHPAQGGLSRKRFWMPAHVAFELSLIASLVLSWSQPPVRNALLIALTSHAVMRIWSAFDFIPKALAYERADPASLTEELGRAWTARSWMRLPLDVVTCGAVMAAFAAAVRL